MKSLYPEAKASINIPLNTITIRVDSLLLPTIIESLRKIDQPVPQIVIIARVWNVSKLLQRHLGLTPNDFSLDLKYILPPGVKGFTLDSLTDIVPGRFRLLSEEAESRLLVSPKITVASGVSCEISSTINVPIQTTASTGTVITTSVQYVEVGTKLNVRPIVYKSEEILLIIEGAVSSVTSITGSGYPETSKRAYNTQLTLKSGYTVVLGGLLSEEKIDTKQGTILREIPLIGILFDWIFGNVKTSYKLSEIIVTITPILLTPDMITQPGQPEPKPEMLKEEENSK